MKKILLLISVILFLSFSNDTDKIIYKVEPSITSGYIEIVTYPAKQAVNVKIMDLSGFLRMEKEIHLDKQIDVTSLPDGTYLVKISSDKHMAIVKFVKGGDVVEDLY